MFRSSAIATLTVALCAAPAMRAQVDETAWKTAVVDGMRAAGAHDYPKAEQELLKALHEAQRLGVEGQRVGTTLNSLGLVYRAEKKFSDAENAYRRALIIMETMYGDGTDAANVNFNIAGVMLEQGKPAEALPYINKTLASYERLFGSASVKTAAALCMQGDAMRVLKRYPEAESPLRRCADIREAQTGLYNAEMADALQSLARVYVALGKFAAAEPRFKLVEKIREKTSGITSPLLADAMEEHAAVLRSLGRENEAEKLVSVSGAIRKSAKGK